MYVYIYIYTCVCIYIYIHTYTVHACAHSFLYEIRHSSGVTVKLRGDIPDCITTVPSPVG